MRSQVTLCVHWGDEILGHSAWAKRDFHSSLFQSGGRKPKTSWTSRRAKNPKRTTLEMPRIELGASYMRSMRSTTELHPLG